MISTSIILLGEIQNLMYTTNILLRSAMTIGSTYLTMDPLLSLPHPARGLYYRSIASCELVPLCFTSTQMDPSGSDHMPIITTIQNIRPSSYRLAACKLHLSKPQFIHFHFGLVHATDRFCNSLSSSSLSPLQRYDLFCSLLKETLATVISVRSLFFKRTHTTRNRISASWWNDQCTEAVNNCRILYRLYKNNPTRNLKT